MNADENEDDEFDDGDVLRDERKKRYQEQMMEANKTEKEKEHEEAMD